MVIAAVSRETGFSFETFLSNRKLSEPWQIPGSALPHGTMSTQMSQESGLPGSAPVAFLQHAGHDHDVRDSSHRLLAGLLITFVLFVTLPLTQIISEGIRPDVPVIRPIAITPPAAIVEPEKIEPPKREELIKPELVETPPKPKLDQIGKFPKPGPGPYLPGIVFDPGLIDPGNEEIFENIGLDRSPNAISLVAPNYPPTLARERVEGTVLLQFVVTSVGKVTQVRVLSSTRPEFEKPAIAALEQWRFEPGVKNGMNVSVRVQLPMRFKLNQ